MAEPGGIAASPAIREAAHLQGNCAFVDGGWHHAKNIRRSLHIYHVLPRESASRRPIRAASRMRRADIAIRKPMLWGTVAATALLLAGSLYLAFSQHPAPSVSTAALSLSTEQLEQALAERRKADALAAEKRRLERQAQQRAEAETEAKRQADLELASARQARQQAERELAQLKADIDARRNAKDAGGDPAAVMAERATEQAAQRSAETEAAALLQAEEQAARKAAADAEAKRRADQALAVATQRREQAETEALAAANKAAANKAAAGRAKPNEEAEAAEQRLHLELADRRRLQVALTSLGFDTRGHDGVFGPRSREMIARWQNARNLPATGFLTRAQQQALLQETEPMRASDDEQKKPAASHLSGAADASWVAYPTLENPACAAGIGGAQRPADWQVDIKGNTLTYTSRSTKSSFTVDLKALQPDGSGRVVGKDDKNREFYVTFAPGSGARPFHEASSVTPCRYVYTPKTGGYSMRYMTIAGVLGVLATQAQAESKTYCLEVIPEKSVQACGVGCGPTYTVDVSNGVLTLGVNYARRLFSEPVKSDGKITASYRDPSGATLKFIGHGNGEYQISHAPNSCNYRLVPTVGKPPWNG
jgi:peptidoglycan hydrolase-like protein with peptidoglycan-binding domain